MAVNKKGKPVPTNSNASKDGYFGVVKTFKHKLHVCCRDAEQFRKGDIVFLWVYVDAKGLKQGFMEKERGSVPIPTQQWLSIIDEAASLGANWLVLSLRDALNKCAGVYEICQWAQRVHGMNVGLHLKGCTCPEKDEVALLRKLDRKKTKLLMHCPPGKMPVAKEIDGITVWIANPQPDGEKPKCQGAARMIFVNEKGILYTCGLVEGKEDYRIGHVFDECLKTVLTNPKTPRKVCDDLHKVSSGCDGCPSLVTTFLPRMRRMP